MSTYAVFTNKVTKKKLIYYPCPKNANTSAKMFFAKHLNVDKNYLFLGDQNLSLKCKYNEKTFLPISLLDLKSKIINLITTYKFNENSSVKIKDYTLEIGDKKSLTKLKDTGNILPGM